MRNASPRDWILLACAVVLGFGLAAVLPDWAWQTFTALMIVAFLVLSIRKGTLRSDGEGTLRSDGEK